MIPSHIFIAMAGPIMELIFFWDNEKSQLNFDHVKKKFGKYSVPQALLEPKTSVI